MITRRRALYKKVPGIPVSEFQTWIIGKTINATTGAIQPNVDVQYCDAYIPVTDYAIDDKIVFIDDAFRITSNNNFAGFYIALAFYGANDAFIERIGYESGNKVASFNIPQNAETFRIVCVYKIDENVVRPSTGNVPLSKLYLQY